MPLKKLFGFPKDPFMERFLKGNVLYQCEDLIIGRTSFHNKEPFVEWKGSVNVKDSSLNHTFLRVCVT